MKSYKQHLVSSNSFGEKINTIKKPVFRGSAIFTIINNKQLKTRILYMGYWLVKRHIKEICLLATLRNKQGNILLREQNLISQSKSEQVDVSTMLLKTDYANTNFIGSIELEIFSTVDLVFPYPAFVVNYYNKFASTFVHTTGRIYNDIEDTLDNETTQVKESGFDLFACQDSEPFFTFVNGYIENNASIQLEIINHKNKIYYENIELGTTKPLETVFVNLKDYIPVKDMLDGQTGTMKIKHNLSGFFPRFIAGNLSKKTGTIAVTHTYYDNSDNTKKDAYWYNNHKDILNDSMVYVPLFLTNNYYTQLKYYPIHSPSDFTTDIEFYNKDGRLLDSIKRHITIKKYDNNYFSINFKSLANKLKLDYSDIAGAKLINNYTNKKNIPTRLKYGLNVGIENTSFDMPTNICFSPSISNIKTLDKKGSFRWLPLLNTFNSIATIDNSSYVKNYKQLANIQLTFYRQQDTKIITRNCIVPANGREDITIDKELGNFYQNMPGWMTIKSDTSFTKAWYFELNNNGIMGGDHSF